MKKGADAASDHHLLTASVKLKLKRKRKCEARYKVAI